MQFSTLQPGAVSAVAGVTAVHSNCIRSTTAARRTRVAAVEESKDMDVSFEWKGGERAMIKKPQAHLKMCY